MQNAKSEIDWVVIENADMSRIQANHADIHDEENRCCQATEAKTK
jgi:hypothetical protein